MHECTAGLTDAAGLSDLIEGPQQVSAQLLDIVEIVQHGVGQVHEVVQINGIALGPPESHVECSGLPCQRRTGDTLSLPAVCQPSPSPQIPSASPVSYDLAGHRTGRFGFR